MPSNDDLLNVYALVMGWAESTDEPVEKAEYLGLSVKLSQIYRRRLSSQIAEQISSDLLSARNTRTIGVTAVSKPGHVVISG